MSLHLLKLQTNEYIINNNNYIVNIIGGEILSIPVTVEITKNTDSITVVVDDPVSVTGNNQDSSAGHQSTYLIDREATLTRHENDSFDDTVLTNPQKGDNIFL